MNTNLLLVLGAALARLTVILILAFALLRQFRGAEPRWRVLVCRAVYVVLPLSLVAGALAPRLIIPLLPAENALSARAAVANSAVDASPSALPDSQRVASPAAGRRASLARTAVFTLLPWFAVALILVAREAVRLRRFTATRLFADTERAGKSLSTEWEKICAAFGIRPPELRVAAEQTSPYLSCGFSNALVIPRSLTAPGQLDRLRHVFSHEAVHLANRDRGWILMARFLTCCLWFHPFAWWLESLHLRACEEACDAEAARRGGTEDYSSALAALALDLVPQQHPATAFLRLPSVRERIRSLRGHARMTPPSRRKSLPLVVTIILTGLAAGNFGLAQKSAPTPESRAGAEEKLRSTIIPSIEFRDTSLRDAIDYLQRRSAELDSLGTSVTMILSEGARAVSDRKITLRLMNVPLSEALRYTTSLANMSFRVDGGKVIIETATETKTAAPSKKTTAQPVIEKLSTIIVPSIEFDDSPLTEAIKFLRQKSIELDTATTDPQVKGVNFLVMDGPRAKAPITLKLSNVSLMDALRYVTELSGTALDIRPFGVVIMTGEKESARGKTVTESATPGELYTKVYSLPKRIYEKALAESGTSTAKDLLTGAGIKFPPGSAAVYNPGTHQFVIRNTTPQLDRLDTWLAELARN